MNELRRTAEAIVDRISTMLGRWGGYVTLKDTEFRAWHPDQARLDAAMARVPGAELRPPRVDQTDTSGVWHIPLDSRDELARALRVSDQRAHKFVINARTAKALQIRPQIRITTKLSRRIRRLLRRARSR
jgi:hypothetical protein